VSFTPGPWEAKPYGVRPDDGPTCYRITSENGEVIAYTPEYSRLDWDNACLLKAAPDMYAALEALATWSWGQAGMDSDDLHQRGYAMARRDVKTEIAAALAKARGEAS